MVEVTDAGTQHLRFRIFTPFHDEARRIRNGVLEEHGHRRHVTITRYNQSVMPKGSLDARDRRWWEGLAPHEVESLVTGGVRL